MTMARKILKSPVALVQVLVVSALILCIVSARERRGASSSSSSFSSSSHSLYDDEDDDRYPSSSLNEDDTMRPCPFECDCKGFTVDCSNRGLTYVPKNIPSLVRKLDLRQNEILDVKDGFFQGYSHLEELILFQNNLTATRAGMFRGLKNLKTLLLNSNNISRVDRDTFTAMSGNLKLLSLYDNRIETLDEGTFDSLQDIQILHLGKNPFRCDCNLRWLADYLSRNSVETTGAKCEVPKRFSKRKITAVDYNRMACRVQADQVPVFERLSSSDTSKEGSDSFPCPDNCSCHGSNIKCGSLEVTAGSSSTTTTLATPFAYPFFTSPSSSSSSSSSEDNSEDLYLDDHSAPAAPSSVSFDMNDLNKLSRRLSRMSKHLNKLSKEMNKLSKQMSDCQALNKTGKHNVKCYN